MRKRIKSITFFYELGTNDIYTMRFIRNGNGNFWDIFGLSLGVNALIMLVGTVICFAAATPLMAMFTTNPETVRLGASALKIISIGFIPSALSVTVSGALEGLGKGTQSLAISMLRYIIVIIPAAYLLCFFAGAGTVWYAFWIEEVISS